MKHTNKIFTLIVGGVLLTQPLWAASTYVDPFDSTPKPRSLAMGNTGVAYGNDVHTVFYNPASLGGIKGMQFLASSGATLQDVNNTTEVMAFPIGSSQTAAVSLGYSAFQVSNILNANYVQGVPTIVGAASFSNSVFFASAANQTSFGKFGILAKSFNNNLSLQGPGTGFSGQGTNVDVGALWSLNSSTQVGLAFKNVLSTQSIKYSSGAVDALAQKTVLGIGTRFVNSSGNYLGLAMDYEYISNTPGYGLWHGGVEWGFDRNIALRAGMNQVLQSQQNVVVASQLTLGVGVRWSGLHLSMTAGSYLLALLPRIRRLRW
jgi:hypothetical protein